MLMSGLILRWYSPFSDSWRQGATFVHDWFANGLLFAIGGHIVLAFRDPDALEAMKRGSVNASWAERHRPRWYAEMVGSDGGGAQDAVSDVGARAAHDATEPGLRAREVPVVDPVHSRPGDGIGDREL